MFSNAQLIKIVMPDFMRAVLLCLREICHKESAHVLEVKLMEISSDL